jgi:CubicO group peptidase (beta-lactamase class C family)
MNFPHEASSHSPILLKRLFMKVLRLPFFFLIAGLIVIGSCRSEKSYSDPASMEARLDSLFSSAVDQGEIPSAAVYMEQGGEVLFHRAYGFREIESHDSLHRNDIFRMASMTKGLTAVAILQLCEQGLIDPLDELWEFIPEFREPEVLVEILDDSSFRSRPASREITIHDLLTHTSGIGYGFQDENYNSLVAKHGVCEGFGEDEKSSTEHIRRIASLPLLRDPGEAYIYGLNYDVLGVVVEVVSGERYDQYIHRHILTPLGMKDSYFILPEDAHHRLVKPYEPGPGGLVRTAYPDTAYPLLPHRVYFSGGADLCSTAEDYARFVRMVLNRGYYKGNQVLGEPYADLMRTRQTPLGEEDSYQGYGTWTINELGARKGGRPIGSFDFGGFWDTYSWADPENDLVAVLLLQMYPGNEHDIHAKFQEIVYHFF